jgi:DNA-binding NtrC family response regulator
VRRDVRLSPPLVLSALNLAVLDGEIAHPMENSARLHVLVVDDEPLIRWSLAETLGDSGHRVSEAADGAGALLLLIEAILPVDVVVLDYRLPDSNDLALLSNIRTAAPRAAVILMTAFGTSAMSDGALALGAYRVVAKPFEVHEMADLVLEAHASAQHGR